MTAQVRLVEFRNPLTSKTVFVNPDHVETVEPEKGEPARSTIWFVIGKAGVTVEGEALEVAHRLVTTPAGTMRMLPEDGEDDL